MIFFNIGVSGIILILGLSPGTYGNNVCDVSYNYASLRRKQLKTRLRRAGASCACFFLIPETSAQKSLIPGSFWRPPHPRGGYGWPVKEGLCAQKFGD